MTHATSTNFLGISDASASYDTAKIAVLPVPYEHTVSYGGGTARGPAAIIEASAQIEFYDEVLGGEFQEIGIATLPALELAGLAPDRMRAAVSSAVAGIVADGKLPLMLGGEHSITPAAVEAVAKAHPDITVVQFDAHADLRQEYQGEPWSHACAMARVRDLCPAVQVGIRNISEPEMAWVRREKLPVFFAHEMRRNPRWMHEALAAIATEKVYVTVDLDAFDSSLMSATGTPEPGGMNWYDVVDFLQLIFETKRVAGFDIVELAPVAGLHACDFLAAKLAYRCIGLWATR